MILFLFLIFVYFALFTLYLLEGEEEGLRGVLNGYVYCDAMLAFYRFLLLFIAFVTLFSTAILYGMKIDGLLFCIAIPLSAVLLFFGVTYIIKMCFFYRELK